MAKSSAAPAHTPTPWFYGESKGGKMYVYAQDKRPVFAVNVSATGRPAAEIEATKKFIVTACNAHQALYEALSALVIAARAANICGQALYGSKVITDSEAALALADAAQGEK